MRNIFLISIIAFVNIIGYSQNIVLNGNFEENKYPFMGVSSYTKVNNVRFFIDSFTTAWKHLYGIADYINIGLPLHSSFTKFDFIVKPFKNNGCSQISMRIQSFDTTNIVPEYFVNWDNINMDSVYTTYDDKIYQTLKSSLIIDTTYVISYRYKMGATKDSTIFSNIINGIGVLFSNSVLQDAGIYQNRKYKYNYKKNLQDTTYDTSYKWRLIENEFVSDSNYIIINFANFIDHRKLKILKLNYKIKNRTPHFTYNQDLIHFYNYIDDIRLLPKWQYLKTSKDTSVCIGDSVTMNVLSGIGSYQWRNSKNPTVILSTNTSLKVQVVDSETMYEVMSPYDTASIMIYGNTKKITYDTLNYKSCNKIALKISDQYITNWNDNSKDTQKTITQSGTYWYETKSKCDIKRTQIYASIENSYLDSHSIYSCHSFKFNDSLFTQSGLFNKTYKTVNQCDSTIIRYITIGLNNSMSLQNGTTYTSHSDNVSYQWYRCHPWRKIVNETKKTFTTYTKGSYAVVVSDDKGCTDTSDCIELYSSSVNTLVEPKITIYPNPASSLLSVDLGRIYTQVSFRIYDLMGRLLINSTFKNIESHDIKLDQLAKGTYYFKIETESHTQFFNFLKD